MKMRWVWMWIGGSITRVAGTGIVVGAFIVLYGATPGQAFADFLTHLPDWMSNPSFKLTLVVIGLVLIFLSLHFHVWSLRQQAIDALAEDVSWAIHHLLNRPVKSQAELDQWEADFQGWCQRVSTKLENRPFFTRADQLHFDHLGFVPPTTVA